MIFILLLMTLITAKDICGNVMLILFKRRKYEPRDVYWFDSVVWLFATAIGWMLYFNNKL